MQVKINAKMVKEAGEIEKIDQQLDIEWETTIKDLLLQVGYDQESLQKINVVVNGRKKGLDYELSPEDTVTVFSPMTGG